MTEDAIHDNLPWSAMRPHAVGESRNCKIDTASSDTWLHFKPIFNLQYVTLIISSILCACLLSLTLFGCLPFLPADRFNVDIDPSFTTFIYLFCSTGLALVASLLRKPLRALEFDKSRGIFWIEKTRIFGWKVGESAQMPLAQVHALQVLSYQTREAHDTDLRSSRSADEKSTKAKEYEINVVFRCGERVNIMNHRNAKAIKSDAEVLAEFIGVPIWTLR